MDRLDTNQVLNVNDYLQSSNGLYHLLMQADGNLVVYEGYPHAPTPVWDTGTYHLPPANRPTKAMMQPDGNFVLYNDAMVPAWATGTDGHPGACLVIQDDRNLVLYGADNKPLWAANIWIPSEVQAHKQADVGFRKTMIADAVLYRNGQLVVDSQTQCNSFMSGLRGQVLVVVVDAGNRAIWVSQVFQCPTCCAVTDPSCASYRRQTFTDAFPSEVGEYAARLDIYQADSPNYVDLRKSFVNGIKAAGDIAQAIKDVLGQLN